MAKVINRLDDKTIQKATLDKGQTKRKLADGDNLFLTVTATSKRFDLRYYFAGKERSIVLGAYPTLSLAEARESARIIRAKVKDGIDPIAERERTKAKEASDKEIANALKAVDANTFKVIALEWFAKQEIALDARYSPKIKGRLYNYLFPKLGDKPISSIRNSDCRAVLEALGKKGTLETAKRVRQIGSKVFRYAINTDRATNDPFASLVDVISPPDTQHFAAPIEPKELAQVLRKMQGYVGNIVAKAALVITPYLLVRPGELRSMRWVDIDWAAKEWRFTASKTKTPHIVPLAEQVIEQLEAIKEFTGSSVWVFPSIIDFEKATHENTVTNALRKAGIAKEQASAHGFRATARTILDEVLGERVELIEHQLAHAVRDANGTAYNRTKHLPARHLMMQRWADYLQNLTNDSNVVFLGKVA